jgi:hypothetical protein
MVEFRAMASMQIDEDFNFDIFQNLLGLIN